MEEQEEGKQCKQCHHDPCVWDQYHETILMTLEECVNKQQGTSGAQIGNNLLRKFCYRQFTLFMSGGSLGKGVRRELPGCVVIKIRERFPNEPDKEYMGYHEE